MKYASILIFLFLWSCASRSSLHPSTPRNNREQEKKLGGVDEALRRNCDPGPLPQFSEAALLANAENNGLGYKTGNLLELQKVVAYLNAHCHPAIKVAVPEFMGIPSAQVIAALDNVGFETEKKWVAVLGVLSDDEKTRAREEKNLPEHFWQAQKEFVGELRAHFGMIISSNPENPFGLSTDQQAELSSLFARAKTDLLMVRSTGKEDTRKMANAGGNESIAHVEPTMAAVFAAAEEVLVSYFEEKSLTQRLGLGDPSLFSGEVFCPILLQRMIGEHGEIPQSGVMFTEEVEGGESYLEVLDHNGRVKSSGITLIQAAFGHNQGVVNSQVVTDTYVAQNIDGKAVFYPIIRRKDERLLSHRGGFKAEKNHPRLALKPALNEHSLLTLKKLADVVEGYYGYPLDLEFVVRDGTLWVVQARPLVQNPLRRESQPRYLDNLPSFPSEAIFKGRTIGAFGGAPVEVNTGSECIISEQIGTALATYLKSTRNKIKCIITGQDAPATSHEATTFRSEGKPVFYAYDLAAVRNALQGGKKLLFSPQQHRLVALSGGNPPTIKSGWISYPLPRELSVDSTLFLGEEKLAAPKQFAGKPDLATLMIAMKSEDTAKAAEAARNFPAQLLAFLNHSTKQVHLDADLKTQTLKMVQAAQILCRRIENLAGKNSPLLERLLPLNYLEALLFQHTPGEKALHYLSVAKIAKIYGQEQVDSSQDIQQPQEVQTYALQLKKADAVIYNDETKKLWRGLIAGLTESGDLASLQRVGTFVAELQALEILPLWLNFFMPQELMPPEEIWDSETGNPINLPQKSKKAIIEQWTTELARSPESFQLIKMLSAKVRSFDTARFAQAGKFEGAWTDLQLLLTEFTNSTYVKIFSNGSALESAAACSLVSRFVDVFDGSIKAMKGSREWKDEAKVALFYKMLEAYFSLNQAYLAEWQVADAHPISRYLRIMKNSFNEKRSHLTRAELEPRTGGGYCVEAFVLGGAERGQGGVITKQNLPITLEEMFTTIHQSAKAIVAKKIRVNSNLFPQLLQNADKKLKSINYSSKGGQGPSPDLDGVEMLADGLEVHYNWPLREHSAQVYVKYYRESRQEKLKFKLIFISDARELHETIVAHCAIASYLKPYGIKSGQQQIMGSNTVCEFVLDAASSSDEFIGEFVWNNKETLWGGASRGRVPEFIINFRATRKNDCAEISHDLSRMQQENLDEGVLGVLVDAIKSNGLQQCRQEVKAEIEDKVLHLLAHYRDLGYLKVADTLRAYLERTKNPK